MGDHLLCICRRCGKVVHVTRTGAGWRMAAHERTTGLRWQQVTCFVRGVDALPGVLAWLEREEEDIPRRIASAERAELDAAQALAVAQRDLVLALARAEQLKAMRAEVNRG